MGGFDFTPPVDDGTSTRNRTIQAPGYNVTCNIHPLRPKFASARYNPVKSTAQPTCLNLSTQLSQLGHLRVGRSGPQSRTENLATSLSVIPNTLDHLSSTRQALQPDASVQALPSQPVIGPASGGQSAGVISVAAGNKSQACK